ncbi:MAG: D-alanine--D-alanine ligase [Bacteroidetes bacterium]|jgi:D-alanine-D-alanine ligase|nr:MAG: D-alanine--D-alanine ligase [Cryomorphaceae bacterium BACL29 MAG-121220-bin8]MDA0757484.1 D-alanine--D-alanine ligase [Bacteroidota bacterium]MDA0995273.1 D-alanine--D-alanine ligase [Pseudomonadota bacterium]
MKRNIAVLMGGFSPERDISIKSGAVIYNNIDKESYNPYKIIISKEKWIYIDDNNNEFKVSKDDFSIKVDKVKINFDVAFIVIHGSPGEDGLLQSYFELIGIPYTGCDSYTSSITFNKRDCISILQKYDIPSANSIHLNIGDTIIENEIIEKVGIPCFVKANKSGSSFGVYKVNDRKDLINSINNSFKIDNEVLIESFLDGIEVSVGVMNYKNEIKVLGITQLITENDFFDYSAKYEGKSTEITPANISELQKNNVTKIAKKIYKKLGLKGFSRSEFIFIGDTPYFLEINSIPGMTNESILPKQAENSGISLKDICSEIIEEAIN